MSNEDKKYDSIFKSGLYFSLDDAVDDISHSNGTKETSIAGAKLLGKTLCNTAIFTGKLGMEMLKRAPETIARHAKKNLKENPNLTQEEREKLEGYIESHRRSKK